MAQTLTGKKIAVNFRVAIGKSLKLTKELEELDKSVETRLDDSGSADIPVKSKFNIRGTHYVRLLLGF